ncbi:MAG: trypsin-like peptidase domain-containing protein [Candidatus Moduliflexus flocculans]|nr:trypsin-like peptidase domain-containing protein [Candidatus Moduliflexus flocculans]
MNAKEVAFWMMIFLEDFFGIEPEEGEALPRRERVTGNASGTVISPQAHILTNFHVVDGVNKITVTTKEGKEYNAQVVGKDRLSDLAVIKIDAGENGSG